MPYGEPRPAEEREGAFQVWAYETGQNLTATEKITKVPRRTLQYWKRVDRWEQRWAEENTEIAGIAKTSGMMQLNLGVSAAALQLVKDASDITLLPADRLASQKLLFALVYGADGAVKVGNTSLTLIDARRMVESASQDTVGSAASLKQAASRAIEARVIDAQAQTKRKTRHNG